MILDQPQSLNRYSYVVGNPTNEIDPSGAARPDGIDFLLSGGGGDDEFGGADGGGFVGDDGIYASPDAGTLDSSDTQYTTETTVYVNDTVDSVVPHFEILLG